VLRDPATGQPKCVGFVRYSRREEAQAALDALNGKKVHDARTGQETAEPLVVRWAISRQQRLAQQAQQQPYYSYGPVRTAGGAARYSPWAAAAPVPVVDETNVYVAGIPHSWKEADLEKCFRPYGQIVSVKVLYKDESKMEGRGVGFVRFQRPEQAYGAIAGLNGRVPEGGTEPVKVKIAHQKNGVGGGPGYPFPMPHMPPAPDTAAAMPSAPAWGAAPAAAASPYAPYGPTATPGSPYYGYPGYTAQPMGYPPPAAGYPAAYSPQQQAAPQPPASPAAAAAAPSVGSPPATSVPVPVSQTGGVSASTSPQPQPSYRPTQQPQQQQSPTTAAPSAPLQQWSMLTAAFPQMPASVPVPAPTAVGPPTAAAAAPAYYYVSPTSPAPAAAPTVPAQR